MLSINNSILGIQPKLRSQLYMSCHEKKPHYLYNIELLTLYILSRTHKGFFEIRILKMCSMGILIFISMEIKFNFFFKWLPLVMKNNIASMIGNNFKQYLKLYFLLVW